MADNADVNIWDSSGVPKSNLLQNKARHVASPRTNLIYILSFHFVDCLILFRFPDRLI
jgi:hypothetical protein